MWVALSIVLGFVGLYLGVVRPILAATPQYKQFYQEADTIWAHLWALAYKSATVAVSYVVAIIGFLGSQLDTIASFLGDPDFKAQITAMLGTDTKTIGYVMMAISVVTFAARMRSIVNQ